jgi:hypothetical protein
MDRPESAGSYCLFQEPWWLAAVAPGQWACAEVERGGQVVARLPYVVHRRHWHQVLTKPPLTPVLGPWLAASTAKGPQRLRLEKDYIEELVGQLPRCGHYTMACHPSVRNVLPFFWAGFELRVRYTYVLPDLSDPDRLWDGMMTNIRGDVRKARKSVVIRDDLDLHEFLTVYAKTFQRQGRQVPISLAVLERVDEVLQQRPARRMLFAVDARDRVHAAMYLVWDSRCAYYLLGGGDPELRSSGATSLLVWTAIQFASSVTRSFDFEGSMLEPVERFFRAFGAEQTPYYELRKTPSRLLRLGQLMRQW